MQIENNCIKLSGYGVDITRLFKHRKIREKYFVPRKVIKPKIRLGPTPHTSSVICRFVSG